MHTHTPAHTHTHTHTPDREGQGVFAREAISEQVSSIHDISRQQQTLSYVSGYTRMVPAVGRSEGRGGEGRGGEGLEVQANNSVLSHLFTSLLPTLTPSLPLSSFHRNLNYSTSLVGYNNQLNRQLLDTTSRHHQTHTTHTFNNKPTRCLTDIPQHLRDLFIHSCTPPIHGWANVAECICNQLKTREINNDFKHLLTCLQNQCACLFADMLTSDIHHKVGLTSHPWQGPIVSHKTSCTQAASFQKPLIHTYHKSCDAFSFGQWQVMDHGAAEHEQISRHFSSGKLSRNLEKRVK